MTFNFDTPIDRAHSDSVKWRHYANAPDTIPMWVADMDFASPPEVLSALHERIDHGVFGYGDITTSVQDAVLNHLLVEYNWQVDPAWLVWLPGLVPALNVACRCIGAPGGAVITTVPIYPPFLTSPGLAGRRCITVPMTRIGNQWRLDPDRLESAITERTRLLLWCHPHNPTGRNFTRDELIAVADICHRHDLILCSDEIHCDLIFDGAHIPMAKAAPHISDRLMTLMAPSKTFNIPGLGFSFGVIADSNLRQRFQNAASGILPPMTILGPVAAEAAYRHGGAWRIALMAYLKGNRELVQAMADELEGVRMSPVEATYLAWLDLRNCHVDHPVQAILSAGVGLSDGKDFGMPGFARLNFGCRRALVERAIERIQGALCP